MNNFNDKIEQDHSNREFLEATRIGDFEQVKYYLTSPLLKFHANINVNNNGALINSCGLGHLDIIRYLLTSPELKEHADIHARDDSALYWAGRMDHLHVIKYLLTSPELKEHSNINADEGACFKVACEYGHEEIMKYLLTSKELKEKTNFNYAFIDACIYEKMDITSFMVFEMNIEKSSEIIDFLTENPNIEIENLFNTRELNNELNNKLPLNISTEKKLKI